MGVLWCLFHTFPAISRRTCYLRGTRDGLPLVHCLLAQWTGGHLLLAVVRPVPFGVIRGRLDQSNGHPWLCAFSMNGTRLQDDTRAWERATTTSSKQQSWPPKIRSRSSSMNVQSSFQLRQTEIDSFTHTSVHHLRTAQATRHSSFWRAENWWLKLVAVKGLKNSSG